MSLTAMLNHYASGKKFTVEKHAPKKVEEKMTDERALELKVESLEREKNGMRETLRDKFAMAAMQAFLPDFWNDDTFARKAYLAADAMLEERKKCPSP